jgi:hypothetical protein
MVQVHKKFTDEQVKNLLERYLKHEIERKYIQEIYNTPQKLDTHIWWMIPCMDSQGRR